MSCTWLQGAMRFSPCIGKPKMNMETVWAMDKYLCWQSRLHDRAYCFETNERERERERERESKNNLDKSMLLGLRLYPTVINELSIISLMYFKFFNHFFIINYRHNYCIINVISWYKLSSHVTIVTMSVTAQEYTVYDVRSGLKNWRISHLAIESYHFYHFEIVLFIQRMYMKN